MSALDLIDGSFPHGSLEGHRRGCKSAACPAALACRDVAIRYAGDYRFSRAIDAGRTAAEIIDDEENRAAQRLEAERAAARAEREAQRMRARDARDRVTAERRARVAALHTEGLFDHQIAERLGLGRRQVTNDRVALGLPSNGDASTATLGARNRANVAALHAEGLADQEIATRLGISRQVTGHHRRALGLPANGRGPVAKGDRSSVLWQVVPELHAEGLTDRDIAARTGHSYAQVSNVRRSLGLPSSRRQKAANR